MTIKEIRNGIAYKTDTSALAIALRNAGFFVQVELQSRPKSKAGKDVDWKETAFRWKVTVKRTGSTHESTLDYWTGSGLVYKRNPDSDFEPFKPVAPSCADVLYSLLLDSSACETDFENWCMEYGYDTDSRKALETYLACQSSFNGVRRMFKAGEIEAFKQMEH